MHGSSLASILLLALAQASAVGPGPPVFERVASGMRGDDGVAVAFDPAGDRIAFADVAGVWLGRLGERPERVLRRGSVRDLAFGGPEGARALLVATEAGLLRVDAAGRVEAHAPGPGELARQALRLAVAPGGAAVATAGGVFVSRDGRRWQRLAGSLPSEAATAVALRELAGGLECWAAVAGELWRVTLRAGDGGFAVLRASRSRAPFGAGEALDIVLGGPDTEVAVLHPRSIARRREPGSGWEVLRPSLPPGAEARRLAFAAGRWWLATDRGLLEAPALEGPWRRAPPPLGSAAVHALGGDARIALAGTSRGVWRAAAGARPEPAPSRVPRTPEPAGDPDVRLVHRAAIAYLDLQPSRTAELRRGLGRRGWLPELSLDVGLDRGESRRIDFDETFSSGAMRRLTDRDRAESDDVALGLELRWELGDTAYHPEAIDLSREARAVIALRDDVLDEITQLYFERRRVLLEFAALDDRASPEARLLRLRAAELAAGIDAWTGGWFSRHAAPLPP